MAEEKVINKEKGRDASRSKDALAQKEWEVAWNFVNLTAGNKAEAYRQYYRDHDIVMPEGVVQQSSKFFKRARVLRLIEEFREDNRQTYSNIRDENIAMLREIASTQDNRKPDRIAAIKELNHMLGLGQENINVDSNSITIEIEGLNGTN